MDKEVLEIETNFSFRELFFYALKRWYVLVVLTLVGLISGAAFAAITVRPPEVARYRVDLNFVLADDTWLEVFRLDTERAIKAMQNYTLVDEFIRDEYNSLLISRLTNGNQRRFINRLNISWGYVNVNIVFDKDTRSNINSAYIKDFLNAYAAFLMETVYEHVPSFMLSSFGAVNLRGARRVGVINNEHTIPMHFILRIALGLGGGIVLAFVVVFLWFILDPKLKSIEWLENRGLEVLEDLSVGSSDIKNSQLVTVTAKLSNYKTILVSDVEGSNLDNFVAKLSEIYLNNDYNILVIDTIKAGGKFREVFGGKSVEIDKNINRLEFFNSSDWMLLARNKEHFNKLTTNFDKVIIVACNEVGDFTYASSIAETAICIIDKDTAKTKNIIKFVNNLSGDADLAGAVVY
ncbi:MAG: hypothetical protein FWE13_05090 [Firmicutes bacterium]|nr:hypothetical protein [Bacillota bacterium]